MLSRKRGIRASLTPEAAMGVVKANQSLAATEATKLSCMAFEARAKIEKGEVD